MPSRRTTSWRGSIRRRWSTRSRLRRRRRAGDTGDGSPATPVIEIAAPTPVQIAADATAGVLRSVAPGQRAEVSTRGEVAGQGGGASQREVATALPAKVLRVARSVDPA